MNKIISLSLPLLFIVTGCGDGEDGVPEKEPQWFENQTTTSTRYIYTATLLTDGVIHVPTKIPVFTELTKSNANSYEIRTNKTNLNVTKYLYTWDNQIGEVRSYTSTGGQYYATFSGSLRAERVSLYATNDKFIASGLDGLVQIDCDLVSEGVSTCVAYGQLYTFDNLSYPRVEGTKEIDFAVKLEFFLLEKLNLN